MISVGDVFKSNDPRHPHRLVLIERMDRTHAVCIDVALTPGGAVIKTGRRPAEIHLGSLFTDARERKSGFTRIRAVAPEEAAAKA